MPLVAAFNHVGVHEGKTWSHGISLSLLKFRFWVILMFNILRHPYITVFLQRIRLIHPTIHLWISVTKITTLGKNQCIHVGVWLFIC